jgi:hypothetical protein
MVTSTHGRTQWPLDADSGGSPSRGAAGGLLHLQDLWNWRLVRMPVPEREELAERTWRTREDEAWVTAAGNRVTGPIVIASVRPSLDPQP